MPDFSQDDHKTVNKVLSGDTEAFGILIDRYNQVIHQQMRSFSYDPRISEELANDVFVEAYLSLKNYRGTAPFKNWLSRIATFVGYKYWRTRDKQKKELRLASEPGVYQEEFDLEKVVKTPEEATKLLHGILATLPEEERLALIMMYLDKCSLDDIAERLGWKKDSIPVRLFRAKKKLSKLAETEQWKERIQWMLS